MADFTCDNLTVNGHLTVTNSGTHSIAGLLQLLDLSMSGDLSQQAQQQSQLGFLGQMIPHEPHTADYSAPTAAAGTCFTNLGATGTVTFTLPSPAQGAVPGMGFKFSDAGGTHPIVVKPDSAGRMADYGNLKAAGAGFTSPSSGAYAFLEVCCVFIVSGVAYWRIVNMRGAWT